MEQNIEKLQNKVDTTLIKRNEITTRSYSNLGGLENFLEGSII